MQCTNGFENHKNGTTDGFSNLNMLDEEESTLKDLGRSPRCEAFVMTGDKILQLNSKISPNFARLKQNELPKHAQVLSNHQSATRGVDGPFSDLDQQQDSPNNKHRSSKYKYLQKALDYSTVVGSMPASHSEHAIGVDQVQPRVNGGAAADESEACLSADDALAAATTAGLDPCFASSHLQHMMSGAVPSGSVMTVHGRLCPSDTDTDTQAAAMFGRHYHQRMPSSPSSPPFTSEPSSPATRPVAGRLSQQSRRTDEASWLSSTSYNDPSRPPHNELDAAIRLAKRLYILDGFTKFDVSTHLSKHNAFDTSVATEYLRLFNFAGLKIDAALRKLFMSLHLVGETSERLRVLAHFSHRYYECNPSLFSSESEVYTLTCALMLLNTDLHDKNLPKHMTSREFIANLLQTGHNYSMDLMKSLYQAVKDSPIECSKNDLGTYSRNSHFLNRSQHVDARYVDMPDPESQIEYKKGWLMRKCLLDNDGHKMPFGRRSWRMFYTTLKGMVLYLHKDEYGFKRGFFNSAKNAIRVHHSLALRATYYSKKQNVFKLQTSTLAEFYFQTSDPREMQEWIDAINFVAACFSSPSLPGAISSRQSFQRPFLSSASSKLSMKEQLEMHEARVLDTQKQLSQHRLELPGRCSKPRILQGYAEKEIFLIYELERYSTYARLLRPKVEELLRESTSAAGAVVTSPFEHPVIVSNGSSGDSDNATVVAEGGAGGSRSSRNPNPHQHNSNSHSSSDRSSYKAAVCAGTAPGPNNVGDQKVFAGGFGYETTF